MREDFKVLSNDKKTMLSGYYWIPEGEVKAVVQMTHGMIDHILRYEMVAEFLNSRGIAVIGYDLLGHGDSISSEDDRGYFAKKDGKGTLLLDMHMITGLAKEKWPGLPIFLLGHSMGSFFTRRYLTIWGNELAGAVVVGTGMTPLPAVLFGRLVAYAQIKIYGDHHRSNFIDGLCTGGYVKTFKKQGKGSWLNRDEAEVAKYAADPKCKFIFTSEAYHTLFSILEDLATGKNMDRIPKNLPVVFMSGMDDIVGDYTKGVLKSYNQFIAAGLTDVDLKFYKDDRHEILFELDKEDVYADLEAFIEAHI